jgi:two-component system, cell cycle response regulator DivK
MSKMILIVEDYDDSRMMMKAMLQMYGYGVLEAVDGRQAIEMAKEHQPELIFMDLAMPEIDGITATETIRTFDGLQDVPIIALTAYGDLRGKEAIEAGCDEVISKPMNFERLQPLLEKYLC